MAQFGQDYRKEVQDANAGNIEKSVAATPERNLPSTGKQVEHLDTSSKTKGKSALLDFASGILTKIGTRQQQEAYNEGYSSGTQEGLDELQANEGLSEFIFGKGARRRGMQKAVIDKEVQENYVTNLQTMQNDIKTFTSHEKYKTEKLDPLLVAALEKQSDPEVRAAIIENFTVNAKQLGSMYTKGRQVWVDVLNRKAQADGVISASNVLGEAQKTQDPKVIEDAHQRVRKAFNCGDMHAVPCEDIRVNTIIERLGHNDINLLQVAEADGLLDNISPTNRAKLDQAKQLWEHGNDLAFNKNETELAQMAYNQSAPFENSLQAAKAKYGDQVDVNGWRAVYNKREAEIAAEKAELNQNMSWIMSGDPRGKALNVTKSVPAWDALTNNIATNLAVQHRIEANQYLPPEDQIDINAAVTQQEADEALFKSPETILPLWSSKQQVLPLLSRTLSQVMQVTMTEQISKAEAEQITDRMEFLNKFQKRDKVLFAKQAASDGELATYSSMNFLMNDLKMSQRKAIIQIRGRNDRADYEWQEGERETVISEVTRNATDSKGFENAIGWSSDPENQVALEYAAGAALDKAMKITKEPKQAARLAEMFLYKNTSKVGNQLVLGGAELDKNSHNGSYNDYIELVQQDERFKDKQELAGFPRDREITDDANTLIVYPDKQGMTIRSVSPVDGNFIYIDIPAPKRDADIPRIKPDGIIELLRPKPRRTQVQLLPRG